MSKKKLKKKITYTNVGLGNTLEITNMELANTLVIPNVFPNPTLVNVIFFFFLALFVKLIND
jgi:hypothetical protein